MAKLRVVIVASEDSMLLRSKIADVAHQLAGASLSVGAASLGEAARRLERAPDAGGHPHLLPSFDDLSALAGGHATIARFQLPKVQ